jgi:serine/threonine protein kinase
LKAKFRGTTVAIKKVFDPVITDDLLAEMQNEARMLSILRHPLFCTLMGVCSKPPELAIVFEFCHASLFEVLHKSKQ